MLGEIDGDGEGESVPDLVLEKLGVEGPEVDGDRVTVSEGEIVGVVVTVFDIFVLVTVLERSSV